MTSSTPTAPTALAHGRFIRGSVSKVRRVLDQIRGRTYRDALIMLEFMPYRSTGPITKVLRSAVANAEHNLGLDPSSLVISSASADMGPVLASGPAALLDAAAYDDTAWQAAMKESNPLVGKR